MAFIQNQIGRLPSFGTIWMNTGNFTGANFAFTTSYKEVTALSTSFTMTSPSQDFAMTTDGRLKYTGITNKLFSVSATLFAVNSTSPEWFSIQIYKNGSPVSDAFVYTGIATRIAGFPISMSTNDYLSIFTKAQAAATNAIQTVILSATSINRI